MSSALVVGDSVNLVDDHGLDSTEVLARFARSEQDVERLGRSDEDVRRIAEHGGALFGQRVAGADSRANLGGKIAAFEGELLNLAQGLIEIFLHVVRKRLERADINDLRRRREPSFDGSAEELVDADEEGCQRFSASGRR